MAEVGIGFNQTGSRVNRIGPREHQGTGWAAAL